MLPWALAVVTVERDDNDDADNNPPPWGCSALDAKGLPGPPALVTDV